MGRVNIFSTSSQKISSFSEELEKWQRGELFLPTTVEIHPSERCNHACPGCQAQYAMSMSEAKARAKRGANLNFADLQSMLDSAPKGIIIFGNTGDPLLHPGIIELLQDLRTRQIPTVLITNGSLLQGDVLKEALLTCRGIRISLDADSPEMFLQTHGKQEPEWSKLLENIRALVATKLSLGANHCHLGVGFLTGKTTLKGMFRATQLSKALGVDYIQFHPFHYDETNIEAELEQCLSLETPTFGVYSSDQKYQRINADFKTHSICHGAHFYTIIDARGDVYICCHHVGNQRALLGNIMQTP